MQVAMHKRVRERGAAWGLHGGLHGPHGVQTIPVPCMTRTYPGPPPPESAYRDGRLHGHGGQLNVAAVLVTHRRAHGALAGLAPCLRDRGGHLQMGRGHADRGTGGQGP